MGPILRLVQRPPGSCGVGCRSGSRNVSCGLNLGDVSGGRSV